ncbi:hypothetical protein MHU86_17637 [Fragilaria crotonensis]|nr:hypothetical protein MHU86_19321 [Fragilaria crotonensis]KAI2496890.1 hypothetical protein MHU86_17637 [Fragilaria crotonensis]
MLTLLPTLHQLIDYTDLYSIAMSIYAENGYEEEVAADEDDDEEPDSEDEDDDEQETNNHNHHHGEQNVSDDERSTVSDDRPGTLFHRWRPPKPSLSKRKKLTTTMKKF